MPKAIARRYVKKLTGYTVADSDSYPHNAMPRRIQEAMPKYAELSTNIIRQAHGVPIRCHDADCAPAAIFNATGKDYKEVYKGLLNIGRNYKGKGAKHIRKTASLRHGVAPDVTDIYMKKEFGVSPKEVTKGLHKFPKRGTFIVSVDTDAGEGHMFAIKNGKVIDSQDYRYALHNAKDFTQADAELHTLRQRIVGTRDQHYHYPRSTYRHYDLRGKLRPRKK